MNLVRRNLKGNYYNYYPECIIIMIFEAALLTGSLSFNEESFFRLIYLLIVLIGFAIMTKVIYFNKNIDNTDKYFRTAKSNLINFVWINQKLFIKKDKDICFRDDIKFSLNNNCLDSTVLYIVNTHGKMKKNIKDNYEIISCEKTYKKSLHSINRTLKNNKCKECEDKEQCFNKKKHDMYGIIFRVRKH